MLERITITPSRSARRQDGSRYGYRVRCESCPADFGVWRMRPDVPARVHNNAVHAGSLVIERVEGQPCPPRDWRCTS